MRTLVAWLAVAVMLNPLFAVHDASAQKITIDAEDYKQIYEGCGVTHSGYYQGHIWSMSEANRELFFQLLYREVNFKYAQFYTSPLDTGNVKQACDYMKGAKKYKPDLKVSVVVQAEKDVNFTYKKIDGADTIDALNVSDPHIYDKIAQSLVDLLGFMHKNGVDPDIFGVANEPDYDKKWVFGYEDPKKGLGLMVQNVIPKFRNLVNDPAKNPNKLKMPLIMGPNTLGPGGCVNCIDYWKTNHPAAWAQLAIASTHQYYNGDNWTTMATIRDRLQGRRFFMNEQHTNKGDCLGTLPIATPHRSILSLTSLVSAALNNGVEAWFYYGGNYPSPYHDGGLLQVPWNGTPKPYKTYYAFKQLNSIQSDNSCVVTSRHEGANFRVISLRRKGENTITVHAANIDSVSHAATFAANGPKSNPYDIKKYMTYVTDIDQNINPDASVAPSAPQKSIKVTLGPYSLTTIVLTVDPSAYYEAEDNTGQSGTSFSSECGGYSGRGYMDFGAAGSYAEWNNVRESAGDKILMFRYVNGTTPCNCDLYLNGTKTASVAFPASGNWTNWKTVSCVAALNGGPATVRLKQTSSNGPNLDRMEVFTKPKDSTVAGPGEFVSDPNKNAIRINGAGTTLSVAGPCAGEPVELYNPLGLRVARSANGQAVPVGKLGSGLYIVWIKGGAGLKFLKK